MNSKELVRYLLSGVEPREEILNIAYDRGRGKGKYIESWISTEMLAKLIELREKKIVDEVEGEQPYPLRKTNYPRCDLWWKKNSEHWLEIKTLRFHDNNQGLKDDYDERITKDLDRIKQLKPPYYFHHLLIVFDDKKYDNGNWKDDIYSIYNIYDMKKEDKWTIELDGRKTLNLFLHFKSKDDSK